MDQVTTLQVNLSHLFLSPGHNYYGRHGKGSEDHEIHDVELLELIEGRGIVDDRFFDYKEDYKGQITFFEHATYERVRAEFDLPDLLPSAFRRNVVVHGVDLNDLIGKCFRIGDLEFTGSEEARPCYWMDEACAPGVEKFLKGKGGLRCRITAGGTLTKGSQTLTIVK